MEMLLAIAVVVVIGALVYFNRSSKTLDINNDGKVDLADAKTSVQNVVEGVKAAADVYMPVSGVIVEVNESLRDNPSLANTDPQGEGWFFKVRLSDPGQLTALMDEAAYKAMTA